LGYKKVTGKYVLEEWLKKIEDSFSFSSAKNVFRSKHKRKTSYIDCITAVYPAYLHNLWQHATTLLGDNATYAELTIPMNLQSTTEAVTRTLALTKWSLYRWFKKNKGKERRHCEKPLLMVDPKQRRVAYANEQLTMIARNEVDIYLDEKTFIPGHDKSH
jgi:hypothetical protein